MAKAKAYLEIDQTYEEVPRGEDGAYVCESGLTLREHPQNARKGDVALIGESVDANGWYGSVTAQLSTGFVLAGNHRFRVAAGKGAAIIPVMWRDVDDETARRIMLADNKTADAGTYDQELLDELLANMESLVGTGYGEEDAVAVALREAEAALEAPDDEPEVPADAYTPTYGIMVVCTDEDDQQRMYEWLKGESDHELRVVAV